MSRGYQVTGGHIGVALALCGLAFPPLILVGLIWLVWAGLTTKPTPPSDEQKKRTAEAVERIIERNQRRR